MELVLSKWHKAMTQCGFAFGPTDENVISEIKKSLYPSEKLVSCYGGIGFWRESNPIV
ncbi:MAG: hypothetical protein WBZ33_15900 [Thermoactinomyces sp.]|jgi:hypothetical protein